MTHLSLSLLPARLLRLTRIASPITLARRYTMAAPNSPLAKVIDEVKVDILTRTQEHVSPRPIFWQLALTHSTGQREMAAECLQELYL